MGLTDAIQALVRFTSLSGMLSAIMAADSPQTVGSVDLSNIIKPTNNTGELGGTFQLAINSSAGISYTRSLAAMIPLSSDGQTGQPSINTPLCSGTLALINTTSSGNQLTSSTIPVLCCDDSADSAHGLMEILQASSTCTLMYSLTSEGCNVTSTNVTLEIELGPFFTLVSRLDAHWLVDLLSSSGSTADTGQITQLSATGTESGSSTATPSTIAMVVLYTFTGLLAGAFLFIIVSGALRVHKHPERYGLVPGWNRDQQNANRPVMYSSRARGLARAVLDSIPLVKLQLPENKPDQDKEAQCGEMAEQQSVTSVENHGCDNSHVVIDEHSDGREGGVSPVQSGRLGLATKDMEQELKATDEPSRQPDPEPVIMTEADEKTECYICFEGFVAGDILRVLPCKHRFHALCVDPWLLQSSSHCPLCRVDLSLARDEQIPDSPPNDADHSATGTDGASIPPSYAVDTSRFNRFLDIWNAQLLPRDARRQALARFHEEAEIRRTLHRQREDAASNRSRWVRFVGSRRIIYQIRHRQDGASSTANRHTTSSELRYSLPGSQQDQQQLPHDCDDQVENCGAHSNS